jgi:hypothetical protein
MCITPERIPAPLNKVYDMLQALPAHQATMKKRIKLELKHNEGREKQKILAKMPIRMRVKVIDEGRRIIL